MKRAVIREGKLPLVVGILSTIVFGFFFLMSFVCCLNDENIALLILLTIVFAPFIWMGVYLIVSYYRRKIEFYDSYFVVTKAFSKPVRYSYYQIDRVLVIPNQSAISFALFDKDKHRLAVFENNMIDVEEALDILDKNNVTFGDENFVDYSGVDDNLKNYLKWYEKLPFMTSWNIESNLEYIKTKYSLERIQIEKKIVRIIGYILIALDIICFILGGKWMVVGITFVMLFSWAMYIYLYPRVSVENLKDEEQAKYIVSMPFFGCVLAMLLSLIFSDMFNYDEGEFFSFVGIYGIILLIPYVFKLIILHRKEKITRLICIGFCAFIVAFCTTMPINFLMTFKGDGHEDIVVLEKYKSSNRTGTDYYIYADWREPKQSFKVTKSSYESFENGDEVRVCKRKSILNFEYWTVHK